NDSHQPILPSICWLYAAEARPTLDLRVAFGSEPTLRAEVLWVLHVVTRHQSYSANEEIGELFQTMFPDSDIAKSFRCGKDKTSYIARFGVADFIKRDLISKVTGPFVLMFDESLNRTSKMKQLDLHVRFWESGQVQSRYLGSQFMGHATAEDSGQGRRAEINVAPTRTHMCVHTHYRFVLSCLYVVVVVVVVVVVFVFQQFI
ncbi:hypothetical protein M9458_053760, partial [Cirrhinus mrigala]